MWKINQPSTTVFEIISSRKWGEPKIKKPQCLKNRKYDRKIQWNKKRNIDLYFDGDDVIIYHPDWYSRSYEPFVKSSWMDINYMINDWNTYMAPRGADPINPKSKKFIYTDNFSGIIMRGEAWVRFKNLVTDCKNGVWIGTINFALYEQLREYEHKNYGFKGEPSTDNLRAFSDVVSATKDYVTRDFIELVEKRRKNIKCVKQC
jgi:hypothetical protein